MSEWLAPLGGRKRPGTDLERKKRKCVEQGASLGCTAVGKTRANLAVSDHIKEQVRTP